MDALMRYFSMHCQNRRARLTNKISQYVIITVKTRQLKHDVKTINKNRKQHRSLLWEDTWENALAALTNIGHMTPFFYCPDPIIIWRSNELVHHNVRVICHSVYQLRVASNILTINIEHRRCRMRTGKGYENNSRNDDNGCSRLAIVEGEREEEEECLLCLTPRRGH